MIKKPQVDSHLWLSIKRHRHLLLMMIPGLALVFIFDYIPMYGILLAFKQYDPLLGIVKSPYVGLANFTILFSNPELWNIVKNTVEISLLKLVFLFPAPVILALMLNELHHMKFKRVVQTISYLPHFLSWIVVAGLITSVLNPTKGLTAVITNALGLPPISLLTTPWAFRPILVLADFWKNVGWGSVIWLATIAGIDPQLYEAASIDGARRLRQIIHITLPCMIPVLSFMLIMAISGLLNAGFESIFNLYNPLVYAISDIIDTYVYRMGLAQGEFALSTAIGLSKTVIAFILMMGANTVVKKTGHPGVW